LPARLDRAGAVPRRDRGGRGRGDERAHRAPSVHGLRRPGDAVRRGAHGPVARLAALPGTCGDRRPDDGRDRGEVRGGRGQSAGGRLTAWRARASHLALVAYADEGNASVGQYLADLLRQGGAGDTVDYFRLWPMSGALSYDSARTVIARAPATVFVANVRPIAWRGNIALPDSLAQLITAT